MAANVQRVTAVDTAIGWFYSVTVDGINFPSLDDERALKLLQLSGHGFSVELLANARTVAGQSS